MKEYKTLQVDPNEETDTLRLMESFGWRLEETREIYNESEEIVGVSETSKATSYNAFMRGFTGNDGKVQSEVQVHTQKNITHFLKMRFSRDTDMQNYERLTQLQKQYEEYLGTEFTPEPLLPFKKKSNSRIGCLLFGIILIAVAFLLYFTVSDTPLWVFIAGIVVGTLLMFISIITWKGELKANARVQEENVKIEEENSEINRKNEEGKNAHIKLGEDILREAAALSK